MFSQCPELWKVKYHSLLTHSFEYEVTKIGFSPSPLTLPTSHIDSNSSRSVYRITPEKGAAKLSKRTKPNQKEKKTKKNNRKTQKGGGRRQNNWTGNKVNELRSLLGAQRAEEVWFLSCLFCLCEYGWLGRQSKKREFCVIIHIGAKTRALFFVISNR